MVKNPPVKQETQVQSLGQEDTLKKEMAIHLIILAWEIPGRLQSSSVQFSCSVMSDSLLPHGLQHPRLPWPSPTPGVYSNSCPLSW